MDRVEMFFMDLGTISSLLALQTDGDQDDEEARNQFSAQFIQVSLILFTFVNW